MTQGLRKIKVSKFQLAIQLILVIIEFFFFEKFKSQYSKLYY